ncbi:MAG: hypothetical protein AB201_02440 [Parcubacteria bacterium C7867-006]|nr:MAG: hypothetical protein AB201_02440 [Parcubacteria bacterium C7867-006]
MKNKIKSEILKFFLIALFISLPVFSYSQVMVPPGGSTDTTGGGQSTGITYECSRPGPNGTTIYGDCGFNDLIYAVKKFFGIAIPLALAFTVVIIAYVGFEYMTSGGNPGARARANGRLVKVAWGIFFMLAAWLIVTLITNSLLNNNVKNLVPLG